MFSRATTGLGLLLPLVLPEAMARTIWSFGDSYTTTMFNVTGEPPSLDNPIGNPSFPGGSFSGGPSWPGHLLREHPTAADGSSLLLWNFANTGAVVNSSLEDPIMPAIDYRTQVGEMLIQGGTFQPDDVVTVFFGTNDIKATLRVQDAMIPPVMDTYFAIASRLRELGARSFLFFRMTPLERTPLYTRLPLSLYFPLVKAGVTMWNDLFDKHVQTFIKDHSDCVVEIIDTHAVFTKIMDDPTAYGAHNNTCDDFDGTICLWWDNLHPAQAFQKAMAVAAHDALQKMGVYSK